MKTSLLFKIGWTLWMVGGGIAIAVIVYAATDSVGWTVVGLLGSSVVLNAIGQMVVQPFRAARRPRRPSRAA